MDFKSYFHNTYQGGESFINEVIIPIFGENKYEDAYEEDMLESNPELENMAANTGISQIIRLGTIDIPMNPTDVFDITVNDHVQMERNRDAIQLLVRRIMSTYSSAFMIFHYDDTTKWDWRFTFCSKQGKNSDMTDSKRYTFLLGPNQSCRTAAENFMTLFKKRGNIGIDDIIKAFDVEALSKEFFDKYKLHYERFCNFVYEHKDDTEYFGSEFATCEEKRIRDYVKKLLGRIVFLHFLQKKGWMGVPVDKDWGEGDLSFMKNLFDNASEAQKYNYLDEVLEPLFEDVNTKRIDDISACGKFKVPYLNGGLFERDDMDEPKSRFPKELFANLFQFFYEYNFTIDENDPNDAQVGVDPEMLGRIFENLLEDNKDKGAFYTPKEIVQYMCKESLIAYLQTDITDEGTKESVRKFVTTYDISELGSEEFAAIINQKLKDVKICDPAIGSGAFPMGLLKELFLCRGAIEQFDNAAEIKRHIIQNNIYGVDIEKGAVDIARLRFWLALIVDEVTPHALPNMDFKIMQGNSLLEQCKDVNGKYVDLSSLGYKKSKKDQKRGVQLSWYENAADLSKKQFSIKMNQYFNEDDHTRKVALRKDIKDIVQQQLRDLEYHVDLSCISDISSTPEFFLWHTWFADVFEKGGFDIVIGNPPYIRQEKLGLDYKALLTSTYPNVGNGTADILVYFFAIGIGLLTPKGILAYITSNKFLKTKYGRELRNTLANDVDVQLFIDFFELPVFHNASTDAGITILINQYPISETRYYPVLTLDNLDLVRLTSDNYLSTIKNESEWQFIKKEEASILNKINYKTISLGKFVNNRIYRGLTTGLNEAFVLDSFASNILRNSESRPIVKKYAKSTDICQWRLKSYDKYFLATGFDIDIPNVYPTAYKYLKQYEDRLLVRCDQGANWYNLRACAYYEEFEQEKIIYIHTAKKHQFYLDTEGRYINNSCYMIVSDSRFLFCFLNSKLFNYFKKLKFVAYGNGQDAGRCKLDYNKMITVPIKAQVNEKAFKVLVDQILSAKKSNPQADTSALETEIDRLVYDLYGLTEEEIAIIEGVNS